MDSHRYSPSNIVDYLIQLETMHHIMQGVYTTVNITFHLGVDRTFHHQFTQIVLQPLHCFV